jgi:hypothetical protein
MDNETLAKAWAAQAQALAEQGIVVCRMCTQREDLAGALQIWRSGILVYAICARCAGSHHVLITPTDRGIAVRARRRQPYVLVGRPGGGA